MSKAIAVIEKPKNCEQCPFGRCKYSLPLTTHKKGLYCQLREPQNRVVEDFDYDAEVHLNNCPLQRIPQKEKGSWNAITDYQQGYRDGYCDCVHDIVKRSEENG